MDNPYFYEIRVRGDLGGQTPLEVEGLAIHKNLNGEAKLTGLFRDQDKLFDVLEEIFARKLTLISLKTRNSASLIE